MATPVDIIPFEPRYRDDFKRLNIEWLEKYFRVEPIDVEVLSKPEAILAAGGFILMARERLAVGRAAHDAAAVIGTCAVMHAGGPRFELTKMAVTGSAQGRGVGRQLLLAALREFQARGGGELFLESNSRLKPALALYESLGFVHAPRPEGPSHYERADVYMEYRPGNRRSL